MAGSIAKPRPLGLAHMAATGAALALFLLVVLWASTAFGMLPGLRELITPLGRSPTDLIVAGAFALAAGAVLGVAVAVCYNVFRFLDAAYSVERG